MEGHNYRAVNSLTVILGATLFTLRINISFPSPTLLYYLSVIPLCSSLIRSYADITPFPAAFTSYVSHLSFLSSPPCPPALLHASPLSNFLSPNSRRISERKNRSWKVLDVITRCKNQNQIILSETASPPESRNGDVWGESVCLSDGGSSCLSVCH